MSFRLSTPRTVLLLVVLLAASLRLIAVAAVPTEPISDFWSYLARARNLVAHSEYAPFPGAPDASYPPGYPLLLTAAVALPGDSLLWAKAANFVLGLLAVGLAWLLASRLCSPRAAFFAALLVAVFPRYLLMPGLLASENLFMPLLLLWVLLAMTVCSRDQPLLMAALAGGVLGLLALTRSAGYFLWVVWPVAGLVAGRKWREIVRVLVVMLLMQHLVLLPWAIRNWATFGRFSFLTSTGGVNLFIGNRPGANGRWSPWQADLENVAPGVRELNPFEQSRVAGREALRWIVDDPLRALLLDAKKLQMLLTDSERYLLFYTVTGNSRSVPPSGAQVLPPDHPVRRHGNALLIVLNVALLVVGCLQVTGFVLLLRRARRSRSRGTESGLILLGGTAAYFVLISSLFFASSRFRWPAIDVLMPIAGCLLASIFVIRSSSD